VVASTRGIARVVQHALTLRQRSEKMRCAQAPARAARARCHARCAAGHVVCKGGSVAARCRAQRRSFYRA
jgi:hypothetical protein